MSKEQADRMAELTAKGWAEVPTPPIIGGPALVKDPDGKLWVLYSDGTLKEK